ncbi:MAG: alpha/beta hydrolase [Bacteroidia bacterium]
MNKFKLLIISALLSSCMRLDSQLFNNSEVNQYLFDDYKGIKELPELPNSFSVADSMRHLFSLTSTGKNGDAKIYAVYIGDLNRIATDTVILYCHGNSNHIDRYWNRAKLLAHTGSKHRFGVLIFDYRGFGMSEGKPTETDLYNDTEAVLKWLLSKGSTSDRLIVYGYSLGSAPATEVAANNFTLKPNKLILEAPFSSSEMMVQDGSKLALPGSYFTNNKIDNAEEIKKVSQPFMWIHGVEDDFLRIETHGEIVYKNHKGSYKEAHRILKANHSDVPSVWGIESYRKAVLEFILR